MIILESIKFKNFLSSGNMPVHIQLNKDPMTLIRGKNGQGKSIMLDALCFGLFGKPYRKVNKGGLVNSINRREAEIIIELTANNKKYKIIRSIAPVRFEIYFENEF
jgi:DNA repair exonuclease SbcCD ATPase subunit